MVALQSVDQIDMDMCNLFLALRESIHQLLQERGVDDDAVTLAIATEESSACWAALHGDDACAAHHDPLIEILEMLMEERDVLRAELEYIKNSFPEELRQQILHIRSEALRMNRSRLDVRQRVAGELTTLLNRWTSDGKAKSPIVNSANNPSNVIDESRMITFLSEAGAGAGGGGSAQAAEISGCPFCGCAMSLRSNRDWHHLEGQHTDVCPFPADETTLTYSATDENRYLIIQDWGTRTGSHFDPVKIRETAPDSEPLDLNAPAMAIELIKEAWRLLDGQDPKTADWHVTASRFLNNKTQSADPVWFCREELERITDMVKQDSDAAFEVLRLYLGQKQFLGDPPTIPLNREAPLNEASAN